MDLSQLSESLHSVAHELSESESFNNGTKSVKGPGRVWSSTPRGSISASPSPSTALAASSTSPPPVTPRPTQKAHEINSVTDYAVFYASAETIAQRPACAGVTKEITTALVDIVHPPLVSLQRVSEHITYMVPILGQEESRMLRISSMVADDGDAVEAAEEISRRLYTDCTAHFMNMNNMMVEGLHRFEAK